MIERGTVIQINPEASGLFGGCFMVVLEDKGWGVVGYVPLHGKGVAHVRVKHDDLELVGLAHWITEN